MCAVSVFVYSGDRTELWKRAISIIHPSGDGRRGVWYAVTGEPGDEGRDRSDTIYWRRVIVILSGIF